MPFVAEHVVLALESECKSPGNFTESTSTMSYSEVDCHSDVRVVSLEQPAGASHLCASCKAGLYHGGAIVSND